MNGKLDSANSYHAACRMQRRGIASELVELQLSIGRSSYHQGRELVYLDRKGVAMLQAEYGLPAYAPSLSGPAKRRDCHRRS